MVEDLNFRKVKKLFFVIIFFIFFSTNLFAQNFKFKNTFHIDPLDEKQLSIELPKHHGYVTASINEPGGNHQNEGALCGLPILYRNSGCFPEYCKGFGVSFDFEDLEKKLSIFLKDYSFYAKKMEKYDSFLNGRDINSKDREEISGFTDYLIYLQKLKIDSKTKISLKNLSKLMDIKKSINLPNNLSLDVIKLRINSCLEVV